MFELDASINVDSIERDGYARWDSMAHVALISAFDDEFELVIASEDALGMSSFARCVEVLDRYIES